MKLLKTKTQLLLEATETYYSDNLRITVDKSVTEFIFPKLTPMQTKLLLYLLTQVKVSEGKIPLMKASFKELAKNVLHCRERDIPKYFDDKFIKNMIHLTVEIYQKNDRITGNHYINIFDRSSSIYDDFIKNKYIVFNFSSTMKSLLLHGNKLFAEINFDYINSFRSIHSIWLYFFLCGKVYYNREWSFKFPVKHLANLLGSSQYGEREFKRFSEKVLKPAAIEVTEKSDIQVSYKKERGAEDIKFKCHRNKRKRLGIKELDKIK